MTIHTVRDDEHRGVSYQINVSVGIDKITTIKAEYVLDGDVEMKKKRFGNQGTWISRAASFNKIMSTVDDMEDEMKHEIDHELMRRGDE